MYIKNFNFLIKFIIIEMNNSINLAKIDVKLKFRRTILGEIWLILLNLITISIISIVWSLVFKNSYLVTFAKLFIGITTFRMINAFISDSTTILYETYKKDILSLAIPLYKVLSRHFFRIIFEYLYLLPIYFTLYLLIFKNLDTSILLIIPGLILVLLNCFLIMFLFSIISSRFRDFSLFIKSLMNSAMLFTPILWDKKMLGEYENFVYLNPITSFVEAIREPFIGNEINFIIYLIMIFSSIILYFICNEVFKRKFKLINFWL